MAGSNSDRASLKWLFRLTKGRRAELAVIILCNAAFAASGTAFALLCRGIIDSATSGEKSGMLLYAALLGGIVLFQLVLRLVCNSISEKVTAKTEMSLRSRVFSSLLSSELSSLKKYHSGELLNRMFSDIKLCADGITDIVPSAVSMITQLICAAAVMISLEPVFALLFIIAGAALFAVTRLFRMRLKGLHKQMQEKEGIVRGFLQEAVENPAVIKVFSAEQKVYRRNEANQNEHYKVRMKRRVVGILAGAGFSLVFQAGYVLALVWGAFGIFSGSMTYGTLTAVLQLVNQIQSPFAGLSGLLPKYYAAAASAERIMELLSLPGSQLTEEKLAEHRLSYENFTELCVKGLKFSYGSGDVISSADFSLKKGSITALTGISGGGKSTLFMLLLGLYQPQSGSVEFHSADGSFCAGSQSLGCMAYVPQGNCLFSGTIRENISFLSEKPDEERIMNALRAACAEDFINGLPHGLDTVIGEGGSGLSEGQAQRIAVARALYSDAGILLLDEATSALDEETESRLLKNISAMPDKTVLIVTHRPAALQICGKQLILKDGVVR